jgi:NTP pyrophosphatase (non-canonical NTP hydrolase)
MEVRSVPTEVHIDEELGYGHVHVTEVLQFMMGEVESCNQMHGWYESDRTFGEDIALLHSELSEALEAFRDLRTEARLKFESPDGYAIVRTDDPNAARWIAAGQVPKPEGVGSELADTLIRLLDTCARYDINLFAEFRQKMDHNWTRPFQHGGKML